MKQAIQNRLIFPALLLIALLGASVSTAFSATRDEVVLYLNNGQGSAVAAFDENANVCWEETFTPYGRKQVLEDSFQRTGCGTVAEERGFTGHAEDNELDLVYMQQRYYDPSSGRFLSMDPVGPIVGDTQSLNRYSYAKNSPYRYNDPTGEIPVDTLFDAASIVYDIGKISFGYFTGNPQLVTDGFVDLASDSAALLIPYVPAGSTKVARALREADVPNSASKWTGVLPDHPSGYSNRRFGEEITDWGTGPQGALDRLGKPVSASDIAKAKEAGYTKEHFQGWKQRYEEAAKNSEVQTPVHRAELMQRFIDAWDD